MSNEIDTNRIVLDHEENVSFDPNAPPLQNIHAIKYLSKGLYYLAAAVRSEEIAYDKRFGGNLTFSFDLEDPITDTISCYFNWFAVSLDNYLRVVGLIQCLIENRWSLVDLRDDPTIRSAINKHCREYSKKVAPEVQAWRNKVAAHFAITSPRADDVLSTLATSVSFPVSLEGRYFVTGAFYHEFDGVPANISKWSLTKVYEDLAPRLWPGHRLASFDDQSSTWEADSWPAAKMAQAGPSTRNRQIALDIKGLSVGFRQLMSLIDSTTLRGFVDLVTRSMTSPSGGPVFFVTTPSGEFKFVLWPNVDEEESDISFLPDEILEVEMKPDEKARGFENWDSCRVVVKVKGRLRSIDMTGGTSIEIPAESTDSVARKGVVVGFKKNSLTTELHVLLAPATSEND